MKSLADVKAFFGLIIAAVIACVAKAIASALEKLASIKIIGILFKILAIPFKIIGALRIPLLIIIGVIAFVTIVLPILKTITKSLKHFRVSRKNRKAEDACMHDLSVNPMNCGAGASYPRELGERDNVPGKINF